MTRALTATLGALFAGALVAVAILLGQALASWLTVLAVVLLLGVFGIAFGLLIATNVRTDAPAGVTLPDGSTFGRRVDDRPLIERMSEMIEAEAAQRPAPARGPDWFSEPRISITKDATE